MANKIKNDLRIDKRIRAVFGEIEFDSVTRDTRRTRNRRSTSRKGGDGDDQ